MDGNARSEARAQGRAARRASPVYDSDLQSFDVFVIAGSVHQERHQDAIINFAIAHHELLNAKPAAFISVSLSAVLEDEKKEAQKYVDRFVSVTGWQPRMSLLLGGALRFTEYDYFQEQIVKFIIMKRGGAASTERDHDFTERARRLC
jgi:menaquinone-dependent protoporphyrinogen oxidase